MARSAPISVGKGFSVVAALMAYSEEQLLTFLRARPDLADPPPRDLAVIAARAANWTSIELCRITLNLGYRQLIEALCLLPQPTTVAALTDLLAIDIDRHDLDAALNVLQERALLFRNGPDLRLHPQLHGLPGPAGLGPPLSLALASQQVSTLNTVASRLGMKSGLTKAATIAALTHFLRDPERVRSALVGAPASTLDLAEQLSQVGTGTVSSGAYNIRAESPLGWLATRGFILATDWNTVVMPREVGLALRGGQPFPDFTLRPPALQWRPVDTDAVDQASIEQALGVVSDITTILDSWDDSPPKLLKAGGIGVRDLRRAAAVVGRSEVDTARLIELASVAGLAGWDKEATSALPTPHYDEWLQLPAPERWLALVTSWLAADVHLNLAGAIGTNRKPIAPMLPRWGEGISRHRRRAVLAAVLEGSPGQAVEGESVLARVRWDVPAVWTDGPGRPAMMVSWVLDEASMLGICALGAVSTLGRAVVTGEADRAVALLAARAPRITSQFVVQADLTAVATGPLASSVRIELESMADLESSGAATVYRFGEQSLRRAFDAGWTADAIIGFLDVHATKGVPQPLTYLVDDIARRHGRVRVGTASCYIRSDDPSLITEMLMARKAAKLALRQLAPTVLVSPLEPETVIATLRATGYLPAEEDSTGELMVRRREVLRAGESSGHLSARSFDPSAGRVARDRAAELTDLLARRDGLTAFAPTPAGECRRSEADRVGLVRRLRSLRPSDLSGSQTSTAPGKPQPVERMSPSTPFSQLELLNSGSDRPRDIATSPIAIGALLELSQKSEWWLQLSYVSRRGLQQINATVFEIEESQVTVGTMPGYGSRTVSIDRITSARVMTEAEEAAL